VLHFASELRKRTGDGSIVEFRSVVDAVRCAIEVQNGLIERNAGVPEDRRIEFRVGNSSLIVFRLDGELPEGAADTHVPWVFVDDLDAHLARAQAGGAEIVDDISSHGYRAYAARDLEGHRWTFAQAPPSAR